MALHYATLTERTRLNAQTNAVWEFIAPFAGKLVNILIKSESAAANAPAVFDVRKNAVSVFPVSAEQPALAVGATSASAVRDVSVAAGDEILIDLASVGAGGIGESLFAVLTFDDELGSAPGDGGVGGRSVNAVAPNVSDVLMWDAATSQWKPSTASLASYAFTTWTNITTSAAWSVGANGQLLRNMDGTGYNEEPKSSQTFTGDFVMEFTIRRTDGEAFSGEFFAERISDGARFGYVIESGANLRRIYFGTEIGSGANGTIARISRTAGVVRLTVAGTIGYEYAGENAGEMRFGINAHGNQAVPPYGYETSRVLAESDEPFVAPLLGQGLLWDGSKWKAAAVGGVPNTDGAPVGAPSAFSGYSMSRFDPATNKLYVWNGAAWVSTTLAV